MLHYRQSADLITAVWRSASSRLVVKSSQFALCKAREQASAAEIEAFSTGLQLDKETAMRSMSCNKRTACSTF